METTCCTPDHPLERDGTSQTKRAPAMLDPKKVQLDDRGLPEMLVWATRYAEQIGFYQLNNKISGDWSQLVKKDPAVLVALISLYDHKAFLAEYRLLEEKVLASAGDSDSQLVAFQALCGKLIDLACLFNDWLAEAPPELLVYRELKAAISAELAPAVRRLKAYDLTASKSLEAADGSQVSMSLDYSELEKNASLWTLESVSAEEALNIYRGDDWGQQVKAATDRVSALFVTMHRILVRTVSEAPSYLKDSLDWPQHQPHMALLIAFLKVFSHAQGSMNDLTEKHLHHYYEKVLRLGRKSSVADSANLVFTLSNNLSDSLSLEKGLLFKAGKDDQGNALRYALSNNATINKAIVKEVRAIFSEQKNGEITLHASLDANSSDGQGKAFEDEENAFWQTFGQDNSRPEPALGLVIASPLLQLAEGIRTIRLTVGVSKYSLLPTEEVLNDLFEAEISTLSAWLPLPRPTVSLPDAVDDVQPILFEFTLGADDEAISVFEEGSDLSAIQSEWPLLKLIASGDSVSSNLEFLMAEPIVNFSLAVDVTGVRNLLLENDLGPVAANKPFAAFGPSPKKGGHFLVGSEEAFGKQLTDLTLTIEWEEMPTFSELYSGYGENLDNANFTCGVSFLDKSAEGGWRTQVPTNANLFNLEPTPYIMQLASISEWAPDASLPSFNTFSHDLKRGYMRLELEQTLLHESYLQVYTEAAIAMAKAPAEQADPEEEGENTVSPATTLPNKPFVPIVKSLKLDYNAADEWNLEGLSENKDIGQLFHLHPFGHEELGSSTATTPITFVTATDIISAPESDALSGASKQIGELLIGLEGTPETENGFATSILFQVAEGTEDPRLILPPTVKWWYLAGNSWESLEPDVAVEDGTDGFIRSGIVTVKFGADADKVHTVLPSDYVWLKASVSNDPNGVCDMIDIRAQAAKVIFKNDGNSLSHLAQALPAGTITKMVSKDASISAIEQPYSSSGGQLPEQDASFYVRVSERLRHKERAVTIWDYERLILEHFPEVYKVKCINHATAVREVAPGNIIIVVIPNVVNKNGVDRIKPYASQALRDDIKALIQQLSPHHVADRIQVINPAYEEIETEFTIDYKSGVDDFDLATEKLRQDLVQYLSPWAFSDGEDIVFGNKIHASAIVDFIDERPYVDSIHNFKMKHKVGTASREVLEAIPLFARSALVAAPETAHTIIPRGGQV